MKDKIKEALTIAAVIVIALLPVEAMTLWFLLAMSEPNLPSASDLDGVWLTTVPDDLQGGENMGFMAKLALLYAVLIALTCFFFAKKKKGIAIALIVVMVIGVAILGTLWVLFPM